jgi:hypothetical protein
LGEVEHDGGAPVSARLTLGSVSLASANRAPAGHWLARLEHGLCRFEPFRRIDERSQPAERRVDHAPQPIDDAHRLEIGGSVLG